MQPVRIEINSAPARKVLQGLADKVHDRRGFLTALGITAETELQEHFRKRNQEPNRKGWPKQNFWARIRRSTAFAGATNSKATVVIADPAFAMKVYGGTIRPKEKRYLSIPMRAEAYGVRPGSGLIEGLFALRSGSGKLFLARREGQALRLYYRLVKKVDMDADPRALPPQSQMDRALTEAAEDYLAD